MTPSYPVFQVLTLRKIQISSGNQDEGCGFPEGEGKKIQSHLLKALPRETLKSVAKLPPLTVPEK